MNKDTKHRQGQNNMDTDTAMDTRQATAKHRQATAKDQQIWINSHRKDRYGHKTARDRNNMDTDTAMDSYEHRLRQIQPHEQ